MEQYYLVVSNGLQDQDGKMLYIYTGTNTFRGFSENRIKDNPDYPIGSKIDVSVDYRLLYVIETHTITYITNGGQLPSGFINPQKEVVNLNFPLPMVTKKNYYHEGWYYDSNLTQKVYEDESIYLKEDINMYAKLMFIIKVDLKGIIKEDFGKTDEQLKVYRNTSENLLNLTNKNTIAARGLNIKTTPRSYERSYKLLEKPVIEINNNVLKIISPTSIDGYRIYKNGAIIEKKYTKTDYNLSSSGLYKVSALASDPDVGIVDGHIAKDDFEGLFSDEVEYTKPETT